MSKTSRSRLWARWISRKPAADLPSTSLRFEQLEDRMVPATFTWTGAGANANWSTAGNWTNEQGQNQAPTGAVIDLVFPSVAQRKVNVDDLAGGTVINSITVQGSGYNLSALNPATNTLVLGNGTPSSGTFTVNTGVGAVAYGIPTTLATASGGGIQSLSVGSGATLTVSAPLTSPLANNLTKDGVGRLILATANPALQGAVTVRSGILEINNVQSLGTTSNGTVVATNAGLYLNNVATIPNGQQTILEPLILNGGGFNVVEGSLYAQAGNTTWGGPIVLDTGITSPPQAGGPGTVIGAAATYRLDISGVISDTGAGMGLVKEGAGEVRLSSPTGNTYRGQTNINNGVLTVTNALSLGDSRPTANTTPPYGHPFPGSTNSDPNSQAFDNPVAGTVINQSPGRKGQLKLEAPIDPVTGAGGFTVVGEYLVLNSNGNDGNGAVYNAQGDNVWAASVILGSPAPDGVSPTIGVKAAVAGAVGPPAVTPVASSLAISGVVSDPNSNPFNPYTLTKNGGGRLILSNANTYRGSTFINAGTITIRDSQGLGPAGGSGGTSVSSGATLELDVEAAYDPAVVPRIDDLGRDTWSDSVTGDSQRLLVNEILTINGRGVGASGTGVTGSQSAPGTGLGALRNMSGINHWVSSISLGSGEAAIGVQPDGDTVMVNGVTRPNLGVNGVQLNRAGHPTPDSSYFFNDYSLTVDGAISGGRGTDFVKRGTGHLILPNANTYTGRTLIEEGWVTVQNNRSLGAYDSSFGKTAQQPTIVSQDAALHLRPPAAGVQLDLKEEQIVLEGIGPTHPYTLISRKGALVNLGGANIVSGDVGLIDSTRRLTPTTTVTEGAGVGVEDIDIAGLGASDLTMTGELSDGYTYQSSNSDAFTGVGQTRTYTYTAKAAKGRITVPYDMGGVGDRIQIYSGSVGTTPIFDNGGFVPGLGMASVNFSGSNQLIVVITSGGGNPVPPGPTNPFSIGMQAISATPRGIVINTPGSLVKLGSKTLNVQGAGSQTGPKNEVREGTLRVQNDTALGRATLGTETSQQQYTVTTTEVKDAATLQLTGSVAMNEGGVAAGVQVNDEKLSLNQYGVQLHIAGQSTARFRLNFAGQVSRQIPAPAGYTATYGYDPVALPYDQFLAQVFNQDLSNIAGNLVFGVQPPAARPTVVVTTVGDGVYSVTFGEARFNNFDFSALTVQVEPVGTLFAPTVGNPPQAVAALAEVRLSGSNAPLVNLSDDNAWRGPVLLNHGTRIEVRPNSRLSLLGNVTDIPDPTAPTLPPASDLVKRDAGDLLLGGATSDYRGTTYIDEGIVTAVSSRAFGAVTGGTSVANGAQLQLQGSLTIAGEALQVQGNGTPTLPSLDSTLRWLNVAPGATNNGVAAPYNGTGAPTSARINSIATDPTDSNVIYVATAGGGAWKTKDGGLTWIALFDLGVSAGTNNPLPQPTPATPVTVAPLSLLPVSAMMFAGQIAVAPSDPSVVYYATGDSNGQFNGIPNPGQTDNYAGSGVYMSTDAGKTWTRLVNGDGSNPLYGQAVTRMIVDPFVSSRVYVSTSTIRLPDPATQSQPATILNASVNQNVAAGVWRFTPQNAWVNLTARPSADRSGTPGQSPFDAAGSGAPNTAGPNDDYRIRFPLGTADTTEAATWSDIQLVHRGTLADGTPQYALYAALGESSQQYFTGAGLAGAGVFNAVYWTEDPELAMPNTTSPGPAWWLGTGTLYPSPTDRARGIHLPDKRPGDGFPIGPVTPPGDNTLPGRNGYIKLAAVTTKFDTYIGFSRDRTDPPFGGYATITVYASVVHREPNTNRERTLALRGELLDIQKTVGSASAIAGWAWGAIANVPNLPFGQAQVTGGPSNVRPALGRYDHTLMLRDYDPRTISDNDPNELILGGLDFLWRTADGGATAWSSLAPDDRGFQPAEQFHTLAYDASNRLLAGSDGGLWRWDRFRFSDLNSGLTITQLNSADPHPTDFRQAVAGAQDNGIQQWNGNTADGATGPWQRVNDASFTPTTLLSGSVAGLVRYDPQNPAVLYAVRDGFILKSSDGGQTWSNINPAQVGTGLGFTAGNSNPFPIFFSALNAYNTFPLAVDPLTANRVLIGGQTYIGGAVNELYESTDGGANWTDLNSGGLGITPRVIALAGYQGAFVADPRFPTVTAGLSNTPDPRTIYVSDGSTIRVTKNRGVSWATAMGGGANTLSIPDRGTITALAVNPVNRDEIYATVSGRPEAAGGRIWRSLDAGRTWTDISGTFDPDATPANPNGTNPEQGPLPTIPTYTVAVDPRSGNLYVGNDNGVWELVDPSATDPANVARTAQTGTLYWRRFGDGMPNVSVRDLVLNQNSSTLSAATYGRGMFQLFLPDYVANSGAVRAVSGTSRWTGPVVLTGDTRIGAAGTQQIQNGLSAASVDFGGRISSLNDAPYTLEKTGRGTVILSGDNTYTGQTVVTEGVLEVRDPHALGAATPTGNTVVQYGAALQVRSDIEGEPITINGDGIYFNGHPTGALRNVSGNNVYNGVLTLGTGSYVAPPQPTERDLNQVTIGVDSGSTLRIGQNTTSPLVGRVQGVTDRVITVAFGGSLAGFNWKQITATGATAGVLTGVTQADGAAPSTGEVQQFAVPLNAGAVTFTSPDLPGAGTIGTYDPTDPNFPALLQADILAKYKTLVGQPATAAVAVTESAIGFDKELQGTLVLSSDNTAYLGTTQVVAGAVEVRDGQALGPTAGSGPTRVFDGAAVRIANNAPNTPTVVQSEALFLSGTGTPDGPNGAGTGALRNTGGNNTWAGPIALVSIPNYAPTTNPGSQVAFGVNTAADVLTVSAAGGITEDATVAQFGIIKVGPGVMRLEQANQYTGVTNVNEGTLRAADDVALGSVADASEVQTIRVFGTGTYQLNFGGQLTPVLVANPNATLASGAAAVAFQLERLISGGAAVPGQTFQPNVQVTETPNSNGRVFTITFRGSNGGNSRYYGQNVPVLLAANASSGVTVSIDTPQEGGQGTVVAPGASLELDGTGLTVPETLTINGPGVTQGAVKFGALGNRDTTGGAGTNTYSGTVTFGSATALGAQPGTALTVTGRVLGLPTDPTAVPDAVTPAAAELTKVGTGTVVFPNDKEYRGRTVVTEGALQIQSANALGVGRNEVQRVRITGTFGDQFTLSFLGETTTALTFAAADASSAAALQAALEALPSVGTGNVLVSVPFVIPGRATGANADTSDEAIYDVTFVNQLANTNVPLVTETSPATPVSPAPITLPTSTTVQGTPLNGNGTGGANEVQKIIVPFQAGQFSLTSADVGAITPTVGTATTFDALDPALLPAIQLALDAKYGKTGATSNAAAAIATLPGNNGRAITVTFTGATWGNRNVAQITGQYIPAARVRTQTIQDGLGGQVPATAGFIGEAQLVDVQGTNGLYTLQYTNPVTGQVASGSRQLVFNATAAAFQQALTDPIANGGLGLPAGSVRVTRAASGQSGYQYLVQFQGPLGNVNLLPLKAVPVAGGAVTSSTTTLSDGPEGTVVVAGASLQVKDLPAMTAETVTLNGDGLNGAGALDMVDSAGAFTTLWSAPLVLGSTSAIGVDDPSDVLRITVPTTDRNPYSAPTSTVGPTNVRGPNQGFGVNKVGPGTAEYAASGDNDYLGTTTVKDGTLLLNYSLAGGTQRAVRGNLVVGDGVGAVKSAVLKELQNNQVADTSVVTVNGPDGLFDLNGLTDTVAQLKVLGGTVDTNAGGAGGVLTVSGAIVIGDRPTSTPGGTVVVENGGTLTGSSTTMTGGQIQVGVTGAATANLGPVDMALSASVTGAPNATVNTASITEVSGSTIAIGANGLLNATGPIDLTTSNLTLGNGATGLTNGNTLTARAGSTITTGTSAALTTVGGATRGAVHLTDSTLSAGAGSFTLTGPLTLDASSGGTGSTATLGDNSTLDAGTSPVVLANSIVTGTTGVDILTGPLSLTDSTLSLGTGPSAVLNTGGQSVTLTRSTLRTGSGGATVTAGNLTATGSAATRSTVDFGADTTADLGTVSLTRTDLTAGAGASVSTGGGVSLDASTAAFNDNSSLTTAAGGLTLTNGSQLTGTTGVDLTTQNVTLSGASGLSLGDGPSATLTAGGVTGTGNSTLAIGGGAVANVGAVNLTGGSLTTGNLSQFNSTSVTGSGTPISFGTNSVNATGDVTTTTGQVSFGAGSTTTAGAISATTAAVSLDTTAAVTATALNLTAGHVSLDAGSTLSVSGPVTVSAAAATSDVSGAAGGTGTLRLTGTTTQTVSVADGAQDKDFVIAAGLTSPNSQAVLKTGAGRLVLAPVGATYPNPVVIRDGDVEVNTATAAVQLDKQAGTNPSLSGTGHTGPISGAAAGSGAVGVVAPGVNYAADPADVLTVDGDVTFGAGTVYRVNLAGNGTPGDVLTAGVTYDQLFVNGSVALGDGTAATRPTLDLVLSPTTIRLGNRFTIIQTDGAPGHVVTGTFVDSATAPGFVFVGEFKYKIEYTATSVTLEKVQVNTTTTLASSNLFSAASGSPSTLKQPVTFTATVKSETGSLLQATTGTAVQFQLDGVNYGQPVPIGMDMVWDGVTAPTFTPNGLPGVARAILSGIPAGTHPVLAHYVGDADNFKPSDSTGVQQIVQDPAVVLQTVSPTAISPNNALAGSPGVNDLATFTAQVTQEQSGYGYTLTVRNASNQVVYSKRTPATGGTFGADPYPGTTSGITVTWDGKTTGGTFVADGTYSAQISIDDRWGNVRNTATTPIIVDNTRPTASGTGGNPVILPFSPTDPNPPKNTTFTGSVADTNLTGWTVTVTNASNAVVKTFTGSGPAVTATWDGTDTSNTQVADGTYTLTLVATDAAGNTSVPVTKTVYVVTQPPTVTMFSGLGDPVPQGPGTVNTTTYGDNITVTAVVKLPANVAGASSLLDGRPVDFDFPYPGGTAHLSANLALNPARNQYEASVVFDTATGTLLHLGAGTYAGVTATFLATHDFLQSAATGTHTVKQAPLHVTADNFTREYGDANPAKLTYTVPNAASELKYGELANDVLSGSPATAVAPATNAGSYPGAITQGTLSGDPNYEVKFTNGNVTITQAPLTIRVNDATRARFAVDPPFTATITGFKLGQNQSVVNNLVLATTATRTSPVGTYPIVVQGTPTATNYSFALPADRTTTTTRYAPGTLTVTGQPSVTLAGSGGAPAQAVVLDGTGAPVSSIPFSPTFAGGIRTASADFNQDGVADFVIGTGPGTQAFVQVIDGATGSTLFQAYPFEGFTGGVFVAAGDMTGDGRAELVVTPDEGGGPRVVVYRGGDFAPLVSYFAIDDPNFRGGVRPAVGDLNKDGFADLAVSAGFGGGPRVSLWDGKQLTSLNFVKLSPDFFAFEDTLRNGAFVAIGDVDGDGYGDLITGAGPGGGPRVKIFSGQSILSVGAGNTNPFADFFAGNVNNRGGVKVAAKNVDADKFIDVVTGGGAGDRAVATAYKGTALVGNHTSTLFETDIDGTLNGVFVG